MNLNVLLALAIGLIMLVAFVALVLLWAFTEEMPRASRIPYYQRMEPGEWGVRLERVGRRKMRAMRLINEVLGGDLARAKALTEDPPGIIIQGISQSLAQELVAELAGAGAEAVAFQLEGSGPTGEG